MVRSRAELDKINQYFDSLESPVFWPSDLSAIFVRHHKDWRLPMAMSAPKFIVFLLRKTSMQQVTLTSASYPDVIRYVWGKKLSSVLIAQSIKRMAYFS